MRACKKCGFDIKWRSGGPPWVPINPDGSDHRPMCGKMRYEPKTVATTKASIVGLPKAHRVSKLIAGKDYQAAAYGIEAKS